MCGRFNIKPSYIQTKKLKKIGKLEVSKRMEIKNKCHSWKRKQIQNTVLMDSLKRLINLIKFWKFGWLKIRQSTNNTRMSVGARLSCCKFKYMNKTMLNHLVPIF